MFLESTIAENKSLISLVLDTLIVKHLGAKYIFLSE